MKRYILRALRPYLKPHRPIEFGFKNYSWAEFIGTDKDKEFKKLWRNKYPFNFYYNEFSKKILPRTRRHIEYWIYFVKCHILPSYKFHLIDIRQPKGKNCDSYSHGFLDADRRLVLVCFTILCRFVEKELCVKLDDDWAGLFFSDEEIKNDPCGGETLVVQNKNTEEIRQLYKYWKADRKEEWVRLEEASMRRYKCRGKVKKSEEENLYNISSQLEEAFYNHEEEMLIRLIKIRQSLWT